MGRQFKAKSTEDRKVKPTRRVPAPELNRDNIKPRATGWTACPACRSESPSAMATCAHVADWV